MTRVVYVSPADLQANSALWAAIKNLPPSTILEVLTNASALAESYISSRYPVPFFQYGPDFKRMVFDIAAYDLISARGLNLDQGDANFRKRYEDALKWLQRVNEGSLDPMGLGSPAAGGGTSGGGIGGGHDPTTPYVYSEPSRGW